jgi:hypothetical protein
MLDLDQVTQLSTEIAKANLGPGNVIRVKSEPTSDSDGQDALDILIVIAPGVADAFTGEEVGGTLVQIIDRLRDAGDDRFPIIEYATEEELADLDSP